MSMQHTTPSEDELILAIATHPKLDPKCWEIIANARDLAFALEQTLIRLFPVKTRECRRNIIKRELFWRNILEAVELGLFKKKTLATIPPVKQPTTQLVEYRSTSPERCSSTQKPKRASRHPLLENLWWDEDASFEAPARVDDYLLMSHTS